MGRETYLIRSIATSRSSRSATPHDRSRSNLPVTGAHAVSRSGFNLLWISRLQQTGQLRQQARVQVEKPVLPTVAFQQTRR